MLIFPVEFNYFWAVRSASDPEISIFPQAVFPTSFDRQAKDNISFVIFRHHYVAFENQEQYFRIVRISAGFRNDNISFGISILLGSTIGAGFRNANISY